MGIVGKHDAQLRGSTLHASFGQRRIDGFLHQASQGRLLRPVAGLDSQVDGDARLMR
jgi:hypothetical protein